jgi:hypothetical protein
MATKIERGFARCTAKGCEARKVLYVVITGDHYGQTVSLAKDGLTNLVPAGYSGWPGQREVFQEYGAWCDTHGAMEIRRLKAKRNPHSPCSEKCLTAIGPDCECECAGKNHGKRAGASLR